jgi:hypothetical protein
MLHVYVLSGYVGGESLAVVMSYATPCKTRSLTAAENFRVGRDAFNIAPKISYDPSLVFVSCHVHVLLMCAPPEGGAVVVTSRSSSSGHSRIRKLAHVRSQGTCVQGRCAQACGKPASLRPCGKRERPPWSYRLRRRFRRQGQ